jgi:glycerol transport system ATP-binding protein
MARIDLALAHSYKKNPTEDADYALLPLEMTFENGGAYALLGPSGCGKTTMLNIMSGLIAPSQGHVKFDGVDMTHASPQARNIAQVFQFPVIYDTMTVEENLAFPLRNRKVPTEQIKKRVAEIADMLELGPQLKQRAAGLAADTKQKISLGRGLVRPDVSAILFDEPLTVIDPHLKWQLRRKLKQIHHELKLTLIYVTHDQIEALTFAEKVLVMTRGKVVQTGSAAELFERPSHTFVGHFIGSPGMNFLPGQVQDKKFTVQGIALDLALRSVKGANPLMDGEIKLGIRPEYLNVHTEPQPGCVPGRLVQVQDLGTYRLLTADVFGVLMKARLSSSDKVPVAGSAVWLNVLNGHSCFYRDEEIIS